PWMANGRLRDGALVAQEAKEALDHAEARRDGARGELLAERSLDPGIHISGCGLGQVLIEASLPGLGDEDGETFEGADRAFLHRQCIVTGAQVGQIVSDLTLPQRHGTELLHHLQTLPACADMRVVIFTSSRDPAERAETRA